MTRREKSDLHVKSIVLYLRFSDDGKPPWICLVPRRLSFDENVPAKEGGKETIGETSLRLPSVPFPWSLAVHHQSLVSRSPLPCEKRRSAWGGGCPWITSSTKAGRLDDKAGRRFDNLTHAQKGRAGKFHFRSASSILKVPNHASTNLKKFSSSKLDKFSLFTHSFVG